MSLIKNSQALRTKHQATLHNMLTKLVKNCLAFSCTLCWKEDHPSGQPEGGWGEDGVGGMVPVTLTLLQMCGRSE